VEAADAVYPNNLDQAAESIIVTAPSITIVTTTIPDAKRTFPYTATLDASGGTGIYTWRITTGSLPVGMTLSTAGVISGKSGYTGCWTFGVEVKDTANASATRQYTLMVRTKDGWKPNCQ
jgi:hypothetical protein